MSLFSYNSKHKVVVGLLVIGASAAGFYMRDREKPKFDNGQAKQVGSQVDGRNHGMWIWYFPNGKKKMQGAFEHGEREGIWITFSAYGDTISKATYKKDRLNGKYIIFENGTLTKTLIYSDDKLITQLQ